MDDTYFFQLIGYIVLYHI